MTTPHTVPAEVGANMERIMRQCQPDSTRWRVDGMDVTIVHEITEWTGGCAEGLRDGFGTITVHEQTIDPTPDIDVSSSETVVRQGSFVRGEQVGLWCTIKTVASGKTFGVSPLGCELMSRANTSYVQSGLYVKQPDGRWRALDLMGELREPATYLPAGALESRSETLLADARAGRASAPMQVKATSAVLDDLVRGSRISVALGSKLPDLKKARVALVLSSNTVSELKRFREMRTAFIATRRAHGLFKDEYNKFVASSDPDILLAAIASALRDKFGTVVVADDLGGLRDGSQDFVVVLDWRYAGNFALTREQYRNLPPCTSKEPSVGCTNLFDESASAWLVDPSLTAVRQVDLPTFTVDNSTEDGKYMDALLEMMNISLDGWRIDGGQMRSYLGMGLSY